MKEFFGFGGYSRPAEGFMSWQHLTFVTSLMAVMVLLAVFFGKRNRNKTEAQKNMGLVWAALLIDGFVAGTWKLDLAREQATLTLRPFAKLAKADTRALEEEGAQLLAFAAADCSTHVVRFGQ